ncbi:MAG: phosphoribosylamine--glycine ligase [Oenococcus sp.]|uniref:phosphoribosylamine--glycine ligase n=1 Tax=Oenococcus sp. TaxID=1979414 RepID=UPI0039EB6195
MAKVLIIGAGAREHSLAKTFLASKHVDTVIVAPGNGGMIEPGIQTASVALDDLPGLVALAKKEQIDLTFVGSEEPLVLGVVDAFQQAGLRIFGPNKAAAQLEGSKTFAKKILQLAQAPTAAYHTVSSLADAEKIVAGKQLPLVFKLDGLAAGKGVSIIKTRQEAAAKLTDIYSKNPAESLLIEDFMSGIEFSMFTLVGSHGQIVNLPAAQDHKRRFDADKGPNTGGMGAYSPMLQLPDSVLQETRDKIILPTIRAMAANQTPFVGVLYSGLMLTQAGVKVVEFNVRFGDPETQVVLPQLTSDFYELILDLLAGKSAQATWQDQDVYLGVDIAVPGYPEDVQPGFPTPLPADLPDVFEIDYAAVRKSGQQFLSTGGRVATIVVHAATMLAAQEKIYKYLDQANLKLAYRHDIGYQLAAFQKNFSRQH